MKRDPLLRAIGEELGRELNRGFESTGPTGLDEPAELVGTEALSSSPEGLGVAFPGTG